MKTKTLSCIFAMCILFASCHQDPDPVLVTVQQEFENLLALQAAADVDTYECLNQIRGWLSQSWDMGNAIVDTIDSTMAGYAKRDAEYRRINDVRLFVDYPGSYKTISNDWESISPFRIVELMRNDSITGLCGFAAYTLGKLLDHAGYESWNCYFGNAAFDAGVHKLVLVQIPGGELVVQDAFYNVQFTTPAGLPKDFISMLPELRAADYTNHTVQTEIVNTQFWFIDQAEKDAIELQWGSPIPTVSQSIVNGRLEVITPRNFPNFTNPLLPYVMLSLAADSLPPDYRSIFLQCFSVLHSDDGMEDSTLYNLIVAQ